RAAPSPTRSPSTRSTSPSSSRNSPWSLVPGSLPRADQPGRRKMRHSKEGSDGAAERELLLRTKDCPPTPCRQGRQRAAALLSGNKMPCGGREFIEFSHATLGETARPLTSRHGRPTIRPSAEQDSAEKAGCPSTLPGSPRSGDHRSNCRVESVMGSESK